MFQLHTERSLETNSEQYHTPFPLAEQHSNLPGLLWNQGIVGVAVVTGRVARNAEFLLSPLKEMLPVSIHAFFIWSVF